MKELHKEQNNRPVIAILICMLAATLFFPIKSYADMGPISSIHIDFVNMSDETCYVTLLVIPSCVEEYKTSRGGQTLPYYKKGSKDYEIWEIFMNYQDDDGYVYLQGHWLNDESKSIVFYADTPDTFKILLYYPDKDVFVSSGICETYAFSSYYTVDMSGIDINAGEDLQNVLVATNSYDYLSEIISLIIRVIITILVELGVAWLFKFRGKKIVICIIISNIITQGILNLGINYDVYKRGGNFIIVTYFLCEWIVFAVEAIIYSLLFPRLSNKKERIWKCVLYAFVANIVTFVGIAMVLFWLDMAF